jgi:flagellar hook-associated protein 1
MADLLSVGISGLQAYRRALDTASHNISNANTPGFSRQRVELGTQTPTAYGSGFMGSGVQVTTVRRLSDELIQGRVVSDASAFGRLDSYAGLASRLDQLVSDPALGLSAPLNGLFDAFNTLAQQPSSGAARQNVLGAAEGLASQFQQLQTQLDGVSRELHQEIGNRVESINSQSAALADRNERIALAYGRSGGQPPNDLLDERDARLAALAEQIGIQTVARDDGGMDVFIASGQALVSGKTASRLSTAQSEPPDGPLEVFHSGRTPVTEQLSGGRLGGLLDARRELVEPARVSLGRLAAGIALNVNRVHAEGVDANGDAGTALYSEPVAAVRAASGNQGNGQVLARLETLDAVPAGPLHLQFNGASWQLSDLRSGAALPLSGSGTPADPFRGAGMVFSFSGSPAAGDRLRLEPLAAQGGALQLLQHDPSRLAAAAATTTDANGTVLPTGAGSGDNRNALALAALSGQGVVDGGRTSLLSLNQRWVADQGIKAQQAGLQREARAAIREQTLAARESLSGVNLDEEAADLIRFQQAYQASARVIQVADSLFQTLLQATGR